MEGEAVERLISVAQEAMQPHLVAVDDAVFARSREGLTQIRVTPPPVTPLELPDLQGLIAYHTFDPDNVLDGGAAYMVFVVRPGDVTVMTTDKHSGVRQFWARTETKMPKSHHSFPNTADAIDWLRGECSDAGDRDDLIRILSAVRKDSEVTVNDDGMTQRITTKSGVALVDAEEVHSYYTLCIHELGHPELPDEVRTLRYRVRVTDALGVRIQCLDVTLFASRHVAATRDWLTDRNPEDRVI